ncbi:hypothetical protein BCR42DRAFT_409792 [Absidia repens]|uniref:F-box domain-containing protein n=1 Tax=Absidia repens TaxID=90262 RepID=A0A1X2IN59_9FUNG|nr:hypothetical protein BCR42DRAFT_409792 [Absidia repens]
MIRCTIVAQLDAVPFEILAMINQHLNNQDRYQLCLVNRSMNDFFKNHLFYSLTFHTTEQVISSCRRLSLEPHLFWKITSLSINVPFSKQCPYSRFLTFCQNLKVLIIGDQFWESMDDSYVDGIDADDADEDMQVDLDSYPAIPTLLELDIDCSYTYGIDDLLVLFAKCSNIKRLTLRRLLLMVMPSDMEQVHAICSDLEFLTLDHKNAARLAPPLLFGTEHLRRLGPLTTICTTMKHLSIFHNGLWDEFNPWIYYIADKYPRLQSLDVSIVPTWRNNHGQTDSVNVAPIESAVRVLVNSCQLLNSVRFENVWWASTFFRYRFNKYNSRKQDAPVLRRVSVAADHVGFKIATTTFNLISVGVLPTVNSLDLTFHTEGMTTPPLCMFQSFREARVLTDLRLSTPINRTTTTSILWFLEFCPVLRSLVLDSNSIDVHLNDDRWMEKRKRQTVTPIYQLVYFTLTKCIFTNDIFDYLAKTCPDLIHISLTTCLLHRSPSLQLWFPDHVFRSIFINHVRVACNPTLDSLTSTPISTAHIDNPATWKGENRPVEFITIQRHHTTGTAPTYRLGPCYIPNQNIFATRSMKRRLCESGGPYQQKMQTFKVTSMTFNNRQQRSMDDNNHIGFWTRKTDDHTTVMGVLSFLPLEFINTTKCMNARELDYYGTLGCFSLPHDPVEPSSSSCSSNSKQATWTTTESGKRQMLQKSTLLNQQRGQTQYLQNGDTPNHAVLSSASQQQQRSTDVTIGSHLMVNVYGITELQVNGKWLVL